MWNGKKWPRAQGLEPRAGEALAQIQRPFASGPWPWALGPRLLLAFFCCFAAVAPAEAGIEYQKSLWGFAGNKVVRRAFNPFTVEVFNADDKMAEGVLVLSQNVGIGTVDIPIMQRLAIEPRGHRTVQFIVYLEEAFPSISLQWRPKQGWPEKPANFDEPGMYPGTNTGALVYLREAQRIAPPVSRIPAFDEASFPTSVVGTEGLKAAVLDHVPDWDEFRQQAFLDWLHEGGSLHLLEQPTGGPVAFTGLLAPLNEPSQEFAIGAGTVRRHADVRTTRGEEILSQHPELSRDNNNFQGGYYGSYTSQIYANMRSLSRPEHQWGLIWLLAFIYLLVIFPGCWLVGGRKADYRITYGLILGAVFLFSTAFKWIGKRGYGEQMTMSALAIAKDLGGGRYDVKQWNSLFVTDGGMYKVKHGTVGTVYGAGSFEDAVRGFALNRPDAEFETEVPPFSSRTFVCGGVASAPPIGVNVTALKTKGTDKLQSLEFEVSPELKAALRPGGYVIWGDQTAPLVLNGTRVVMSSGTTDLVQFSQNRGYYGHNYYEQSGKATQQLLDECVVPAILSDLGIPQHGRQSGDPSPVPTGMARVYLPAELPKELHAQLPPEVRQQGRILYRFDLRLEQM